MKSVKREVLTKLYNLTKTEVEILLLLWKEPRDIVTIKTKLKKDRTTIQKCIKNLHRKDMVSIKQINLTRGFKFIYYANEEEFLKDLKNKIEIEKANLDKLLKEWNK